MPKSTRRSRKFRISQIFRRVGLKIGHWIDTRLIIPVTEGIWRVLAHLNPRLYSERLRTRRITEGLVEKKSDKYAVFVIYSKTALPAFTTNFLDAVSRSNLNLVIVSNLRLTPIVRAQLQDRCHLLLERFNLGRDFGGYKDGISLVLKHCEHPERILLVNDSVFFFAKGLDRMLAGLDGPQDFIGVTEVLQHHYHVQSYMLSFGRNVLNNKYFKKFWKKYRPVSTRRWAIHKGEVGLTRLLTGEGFRPQILFQAAQLTPHLHRRTVREALESIRFLPESLREPLYGDFNEIIGEGEEAESLATLEAISQGVRAVPMRKGPDSGIFARISARAETMEKWNFQVLNNTIISTIANGNQIHIGGFLFMQLLGCPIIKRDIFFREVFTLEEVYQILSSVNEPLLDEVISDLRRGGTAKYLKGYRRILYRYGSI